MTQFDGSPGAETPLGEDASHQDASGRVTLPTEGTPTQEEASLLRSILVLVEGLSPDARLWLAEWLRTHPGERPS